MSSRLAFQTQLASIMEVLANAAVAEICKLVDDDYAVVSLQMSQCQRENKALKRKLHLLELKMARGAAERRLRDSAANSSRPRVQIRESSSSTGGAFERQMNMSLWSSGGAAAGDAANQPIHSDDMQCKSPDVQLVEPEQLLVKEESVEANKVEEMEEDVSLIRDDGVLERIHRGASGQRASLEQDAQSQSQSQSQTQTSRTRPPARSSRGVEKEEEPDVVLVKVEEAEPVTGTDDLMGLSIQEGLVESSTDDYRGALAVDEATPAPINHLSELQESDGSFSEVSYGCSALWTNDGSSYCHDNSLLRPSSHCAPLSFMPGALSAAESGTSRRRSAGESSRSFRASFEQQHPVIDLSEESNLPVQASGHSHGGQGSVQGLYREPGQSQNQGSSSSADKQQRQQQHGNRKRVWICRFCGKGFMSAASLDSHTRTHTGERPYVCIVCGKKFSQAWNLKIHTNIHTGQRPYPCTICPERFSDPSNLKKHQKRLHPQT